MLEQNELDLEIGKVYETTRRFFQKNSDSSWAVPRATSPRVGFAILYTPAIIRPKILLIGQNPGNFGDTWDDKYNCRMLSGCVPTVNTYLEFPYLLGRILRQVFEQSGFNDTLKDDLVGMNIWHCQAKGTPVLDKDTRSQFRKNSLDIVNLIEPQNIICIGVNAFDAINECELVRSAQTHIYGGRYSGEGGVALKNGVTIPVYLVGHLTGSRTPPKDTQGALSSAIIKIHSNNLVAF